MPASVGACFARVCAPLAVVHVVLTTFGPARVANLRTELAHVLSELGVAAHKSGRTPAGNGAILIEPDTLGHLCDIGFAKAGVCAMLAFLGATNACFNACSMVVV